MTIKLLAAAVCAACSMSAPSAGMEPAPTAGSRDAWIEVDGVNFFARLHIPLGAAQPMPGVVIVHGSGPVRHDDMAAYVRAAHDLGLAALTYDKRGVGQSGGVYSRYSVLRSHTILTRLADDAAGVRAWLTSQPDIDPGRIGYMGPSQAGWVAPLAASRRGDAAFIIIGCGPPVSAGEEDYYSRLTGDGTRPGFSVRRAHRHLRSFNDTHGYDPRPVLAALETPTLWIFGEEDRVIPTRASVRVIEGLRREGAANHAAHVVDNMTHNFEDIETGEPVPLAPLAQEWLNGVIGR